MILCGYWFQPHISGFNRDQTSRHLISSRQVGYKPPAITSHHARQGTNLPPSHLITLGRVQTSRHLISSRQVGNIQCVTNMVPTSYLWLQQGSDLPPSHLITLGREHTMCASKMVRINCLSTEGSHLITLGRKQTSYHHISSHQEGNKPPSITSHHAGQGTNLLPSHLITLGWEQTSRHHNSSSQVGSIQTSRHHILSHQVEIKPPSISSHNARQRSNLPPSHLITLGREQTSRHHISSRQVGNKPDAITSHHAWQR